MGCPIPPFYGPSNGRGRFERSFFDRLSGTETSKRAKRGHFRGYPKWPFWTPFGHPPFGTPWGPWRGWGHMGTLRTPIGPYRPSAPGPYRGQKGHLAYMAKMATWGPEGVRVPPQAWDLIPGLGTP